LIDTGRAFVRAAHRVREHLGQRHRYAHVLRVARLAAKLAHVHGQDTRRARVAGLLHDLARLYDGERLLSECAARGLAIDAFERAHPIVLHARLGAELARSEYGISDEAVLSAIAKHTVAAARMSPLDTIVYLADALEPGRSFPERAAFTELALADLDAAMRVVLQSTMAFLRSRGEPVAPQTLDASRTFAPLPQEKRSA
jgi:predicted HD superfamily hydrolase involved in NAD metabolism